MFVPLVLGTAIIMVTHITCWNVIGMLFLMQSAFQHKDLGSWLADYKFEFCDEQ